MAEYYPLEVSSVEKITDDSVRVSFHLLNEQQKHFKFEPGQYLTFRHKIGDEDVLRTYSICSSKYDDQLSVGIKKVPGGRFSNWANDDLQAGEIIEALPPTGNFKIGQKAPEGKHYLAFAAGSGITPILSILKSTLKEDSEAKFTLVFGNRSVHSIMFREELEALKNLYLNRLSLIQIFSGSNQEAKLFSGRIDAEKCEALFEQWIDLSLVDQVLICGPADMMTTISNTLEGRQFPKEKIKYELFGIQNNKKNNTAPSAEDLNDTDVCDVTVMVDGVSYEFSMPKKTPCFLKTAKSQNIDVPSSCEAGVCSTCRARVVEGKVEMAVNHSLEDYEIDQGYVLTCQMEVLSDKLKLEFG